jgi:hypothetical protein
LIYSTFSTVGDSRQDPEYPDPSVIDLRMVDVGDCQTPSGNDLTSNPGLSGQDCKWLQNSKAWSRILRTIQSQKPNMLFFNGDMINAYGVAGVAVIRRNGVDETPIASPTITDILNSDVMLSYKQYAFWRGMIANLMETGTYVVPVPGNHEAQCERCGKKARVENEIAWRDNMGDLILDSVRFNAILGKDPQNFNVENTPNSADGITTNQSQLSYSFDIGNSHFAVINTDPVGLDGHAPTNWLEADLDAAKTRGAMHMFVFGHKPVVFYQYAGSVPNSNSSLYNKDPQAAEAFWKVINNHKATYFCGHEHTYNISKPFSLNSYQVLVGAGGSPFQPTNPPSVISADRMYSWATVVVYQSGKVVMDTWGFDDTMSKRVVKLAAIRLSVFK